MTCSILRPALVIKIWGEIASNAALRIGIHFFCPNPGTDRRCIARRLAAEEHLWNSLR